MTFAFLVNVLDAVPDLIGRKLIAPKMKTQAEMNVFFQGALWNLAERYTDMVRSTHLPAYDLLLSYVAVLPRALLWTGGSGAATNADIQPESTLDLHRGIPITAPWLFLTHIPYCL